MGGPPDKEAGVQYAALPWRRRSDGAVEVLLITSRETRRWVIPKGWPMEGLEPPAAAAQEAWEEAGVRGEVAADELGGYAYEKRLKSGASRPVAVSVFALQVSEVAGAWPEQAERERLWTSPAEAADRVQEPELKALLAAFAP